MSDRDPRNESRMSRSSEGRGSRVGSYGRRSEEQPESSRAAGARPQRAGPGLQPTVPGAMALDTSRPLVRYPVSAGPSTASSQEDPTGRARTSIIEETGVLGRAKPTDIAPTASKCDNLFLGKL